MKNLKRRTAFLVVAVAALAAAPSAVAGTATYTSTNVPLSVPDGLTRDSSLSIPSGRTAVESIEVTNLGFFWPASGQDMSAQLLGPDASSMFLWEVGCFAYPANSSFTLTDSAPTPMPEFMGCNGVNLVGTSFRPVDPQNRKLSQFAGRTATGVWTLRLVDGGVGPANQGSLTRWALRIVHAPPTLTATAPGRGKLKKTLSLTAQSNADGTVATGGDAKSDTTILKAGDSTKVSYNVKKKVRKRIERKGRARVKISLDFTDETGGTASESVSIKLKTNQK